MLRRTTPRGHYGRQREIGSGSVREVGVGVGDRDEFRRDIDDSIVTLFALVTESLGWATTALLDQDVELANKVIAEDRIVDERSEELSALVRDRVSVGDLDADELEDLLALAQIIPELERSADLAEHIAQRTRRGLGGIITPRSRGLIQDMNDVAVRMWRLASTAYAERSRDVSFHLTEADAELDKLSASLVGEGVSEGVDPHIAVELALIARFYERIGDHAVNLARRTDAMAAPRRLSSRRRSIRRSSARADSPDGRLGRLLFALKHLRIVPTDEGFFDLFQAAATNARDCAETLHKLIVSFSDLDVHYESIKGFERRGDQTTAEILHRLDESFVTPYDREDIHALAEELDDVVDDMFSAAELIHLVQATQPLPEVAELADVLVTMADEMVALIGCLRSGDRARYRLQRIESLERQGDVIYRRTIARLFSGEFEALDVLKWKDIVQALENSINAIEDVSDVVESILVKNS
jgi:uncharacterized protein